jgi:cold shock CspA family protein
MRFFIVGDICLEEVIGEPVVFAEAPGEIYAVHRPHIGDTDATCYWHVSHVETGVRLSMGDSIDFAIENGRRILAGKTAAEIKGALDAARTRTAEAKSRLPIGPLVDGIAMKVAP